MPQLVSVFNPCPKCSNAFTEQRTHFSKEIVRHQRDYFAQQHEIKSLQAELKNALEKLHNRPLYAAPPQPPQPAQAGVICGVNYCQKCATARPYPSRGALVCSNCGSNEFTPYKSCSPV